MNKTLGQQADIETVLASPLVDRFFLRREQIEKQGRQPGLIQRVGDESIS